MSLPPTFVEGFHHEDQVKKMQYNQLGNTHMKVSRISIGGATLSNQHYGILDFEEGKRTIIEALKRGINYVDTAPFYGNGASETNLGKILKDVPRKAYYIATKTCRYESSGPNQFDFGYERTMKSVGESMQRLGVNFIDLYQLHDVEFADNIDEVINGALQACLELKKQGKIGAIGINGYPLSVLKEGIIKANGGINTTLTYSRYTLLDNSLLDYLPFFNERNVGVILASAHAQGLLTNNGPQPWQSGKPELKAIAKDAADICKSNGIELGKLAAYHTLNVPGNVGTVLMGMEKMEFLNTNMSAYLEGLSQKEKEIYEKLLRE
jgi:L-galactose dehydrogenase